MTGFLFVVAMFALFIGVGVLLSRASGATYAPPRAKHTRRGSRSHSTSALSLHSGDDRGSSLIEGSAFDDDSHYRGYDGGSSDSCSGSSDGWDSGGDSGSCDSGSSSD